MTGVKDLKILSGFCKKKADGDFQSAIFETRKDCPKVLQEN